MLELFNTLFAQILALAVLLEMLAAPFLILWLALSVRRSLRRMADAAEKICGVAVEQEDMERELRAAFGKASSRRISNSAFGR